METRGKKRTDITGRIFGKLEVIKFSHRKPMPGSHTHYYAYYECRCLACGREGFLTEYSNLVKGIGCGCQSGKPLRSYDCNGTNAAIIYGRLQGKNGHSPGIYPTKSGKWNAQITFRGQRHNLGTYPDYEGALRARKEAENTFFRAFMEEYKKQNPGQYSRLAKIKRNGDEQP